MRGRLCLATLLFAAAAAGQSTAPPFSCKSDVPAPRPARVEGKTELVGDVVVTCTGGFPTPIEFTITNAVFTLTFNANVTSKIIGPGNRSEALALLDEPAPGQQYACTEPVCYSFGNGVGRDYYGPYSVEGGGNPNLYDGVVGTGSSANTITWVLPVDPPGAGESRVFRFTNIRLDASSVTGGALRLTSLDYAPIVSTTFLGSVSARVGRVASPRVAIGSALTVANAAAGLTSTVRDSASAAAAPSGVAVTVAPAGLTATRAATLRFATRFSGAARPRTIADSGSPDAAADPVAQNSPGTAYNSESGFYNPALPTTTAGSVLASAGLANWGTRLAATFTNIPPNVTIYVSLRNDGATGTNAPAARLLANSPASPFAAAAGIGTYQQLTASGGTATAVWEVLRSGSASPINYDFGVYLAYPAGFTPAPSPISVTMGYAPSSGGIPVFTAASSPQMLFTFTAPPPVPRLFVSPTSLVFTGTAGGPNPPAQSIVVSSDVGGTSYGVSGGSTIPMLFQPPSGTAPGTTAVSVLTRGFSPGTYQDTFTVSGLQSAVPVSVTLILTAGPIITSLSPALAIAGGPAFTLNVSGANFTRGTEALWNGSALPTTFLSSGSLTAQVAASLIASRGEAAIQARSPDGALSNTVKFPIVSLALTSIAPQTVRAGGAAFTLTATGTGFLDGATLNVGGTAIQPGSVTGTQIRASVPAAVIARPGELAVSVQNPDGRVSNSLTLAVTPPLVLTSISPDTVTATGPSFTLTLTGTGFAAGAAAQVGGTTLSSTSGSATQLSVTVPASMIAEPGALPVRIVNPGNETSAPLTLTVNPPPRLTALNPASATAGANSFRLTATGTGLSRTTLRWNGQGLTTSGGGTQLVAQIEAALIAAPGTASVTAVTTDGVSSNALTFTIRPRLTITSLSPGTADAGSGAFTLTVDGANIPEGSTVIWGAQGLATTFVSASQLTAQVPAALVANGGAVAVTVVTPDGVTAGPLTFRIVLPPLTNVGFTAPATAPPAQDQPITLTLGGVYPVELRGTLTLTFAPESGLPDDPAIQFQNNSRVMTFTIPAGASAQIPAVLVKTGTVAGVITITLSFTTAGGETVTPAGVAPQRIQIARAAPRITSVTCTRTSGGLNVVIDGFTNTREAAQATFDFTAAPGVTLGTTQLVVQAGQLFTGWFGGSASAAMGGVFRYTQPFAVQGTTTDIAGASVRLANSSGTSTAVSCQFQ